MRIKCCILTIIAVCGAFVNGRGSSVPMEKADCHGIKRKAPAFYRKPVLYKAQRVGFEPTVPSLVHLISSQGRYNHFDTAA